MNLFLDIETTGLPAKFMNWETHYDQFPHIVTIAWKVNGGKPKYFIVNQEGRKIPPEATKIHGISTKMGNDPDKTHPASFVLKELLMDSKSKGIANVIGHNIYFDVSMVKSSILKVFGPGSEEAEFANEVFHKDKRIDTMRSTQKYFKKWPTLSELYKHLFNAEFKAHSAEDDMLACERCYNELVKKKMI